MVLFFALASLVAAIIALVFGGLVILKESKNFGNRLYFLMSLSVSLWGISYWFWLTEATTAASVHFWLTLLTIGSLGITLFFTHWIIVITEARHWMWRALVGVAYGVAGSFVVISLSASSWLIGPVEGKMIFSLWPDAGPLYLFYVLTAYVFPISVACVRLALALRATTFTPAQRGQFILITIGALFGFIGGGMNFFLWFDIPVLPYGNIGVIFFPPLLGYSLVRHHLFSFKSVAAEVLVLFTNTFIFVQIFTQETFSRIILQIIFFLAVALASYMLLKSVYREIEVRHKLEELTEQLQSANKRLKILDQQKSEFLSIATHQLRGPLAAIRGYLSLILDGSYGNMPDKPRKIVQKVFNSSGILAQTINDFLNVSRIEQGSMKYNTSDYQLNKQIATIVEELEALAKEKGLSLTFTDKCKDTACEVHADKDKLDHIFFNLIDNAIKYTEKGWARVSISRERDVVRVEIKDSGMGISEDQLPGLFEKFVRARGAEGVNVDGTGLGLYVAQQMVEAHNGKIWAESPGEGKGSSFIVELPTKDSPLRADMPAEEHAAQ